MGAGTQDESSWQQICTLEESKKQQDIYLNKDGKSNETLEIHVCLLFLSNLNYPCCDLSLVTVVKTVELFNKHVAVSPLAVVLKQRLHQRCIG